MLVCDTESGDRSFRGIRLSLAVGLILNCPQFVSPFSRTTKVHWAVRLWRVTFVMLTMPDIKEKDRKASAPVRRALTETPASEIVCLVDDDPLVLRSTGLLLASEGFVVRQFGNGEDFIDYVTSNEVPLVVLDIWMDKMNGLEVLARLCAISPQTHVIVITGREDSAARITATQIGTVGYLVKPFDDEQFLEVVHTALGHQSGSLSEKFDHLA